jgi:hypothetical protein
MHFFNGLIHAHHGLIRPELVVLEQGQHSVEYFLGASVIRDTCLNFFEEIHNVFMLFGGFVKETIKQATFKLVEWHFGKLNSNCFCKVFL